MLPIAATSVEGFPRSKPQPRRNDLVSLLWLDGFEQSHKAYGVLIPRLLTERAAAGSN